MSSPAAEGEAGASTSDGISWKGSSYASATCEQSGLALPVLEYGARRRMLGDRRLRLSRCGHSSAPGFYFYADYCGGWVRSFRYQGGQATEPFNWPSLAPGGSVTELRRGRRRRVVHHQLGWRGVSHCSDVTDLDGFRRLAEAHPGIPFASAPRRGTTRAGGDSSITRTTRGRAGSARMLREYSAFPLFRTVGIDSSFYAPPDERVLRSYAEQLPPGFPCVSKVWNQLTVQTFSETHHKSRGRPGQSGLSRARTSSSKPSTSRTGAGLRDMWGPSSSSSRASGRREAVSLPESFASRLDEFFSALPRRGDVRGRAAQ